MGGLGAYRWVASGSLFGSCQINFLSFYLACIRAGAGGDPVMWDASFFIPRFLVVLPSTSYGVNCSLD